jgi:hypothetical protein
MRPGGQGTRRPAGNKKHDKYKKSRKYFTKTIDK